MKVTVERAQLLKSLGHVHRVVERRNTIPILGNVLIRAENAKLSLKATDLDLAWRMAVRRSELEAVQGAPVELTPTVTGVPSAMAYNSSTRFFFAS